MVNTYFASGTIQRSNPYSPHFSIIAHNSPYRPILGAILGPSGPTPARGVQGWIPQNQGFPRMITF